MNLKRLTHCVSMLFAASMPAEVFRTTLPQFVNPKIVNLSTSNPLLSRSPASREKLDMEIAFGGVSAPNAFGVETSGNVIDFTD
jgi:hypothetical protein